MKPTSLIFLALALVLFISGFSVCKVAEGMAEAQDIDLFSQSIDKNGDAVYVYNISKDDLSKLSLVFSDVDVNIIGNAEASYVELKNFDINSYKTSLSGAVVTVDGTANFLSSLIDMSGGGFGFKGLRYFFMNKPEDTRPRSVNIYISNTSWLKTVDVKVTSGNVNISDITNAIDYDIEISEGDVLFENVTTSAIADINSANGNVTVKRSNISSLSASINAGDLTIEANGAFSGDTSTYRVQTVDGNVTYNGEDKGEELKIKAADEKNTVKANVTSGNVIINDK